MDLCWWLTMIVGFCRKVFFCAKRLWEDSMMHASSKMWQTRYHISKLWFGISGKSKRIFGILKVINYKPSIFMQFFNQKKPPFAPTLGPKKCPPRNEDALERERKETAKRTLELMEARRMVEVAMEGENAKKCLGFCHFFWNAWFLFFWVTNCPKWQFVC